MTDNRCNNLNADDRRRGVVLLITIVILVILATLGYTLSSRVAARRHRDRYIVSYAQAQYGCSSGMRFALKSFLESTPELISRPNEPDFSDVFVLTEPQYQALLAQFVADTSAASRSSRSQGSTRDGDSSPEANLPLGTTSSVQIPGPYGPPWPLVQEPIEFEIGSAQVTIEIEDENAKYPLGWALMGTQRTSQSQLRSIRPATDEEDYAAEASVGFQTFCEWMGYDSDEFDHLVEDLDKINKIRPFKMKYEAITTTTPPPTTLTERTTRTRTTTTRAATRRSVVSAATQMNRQNTALVQLLHSSLLDTDLLTRPTVVSDTRKESAMKYLGLWGTLQVNVNTAPRQVLEAALTFGSVADAPKIADAIIQQRRIEPFSDLDGLKRSLLRYSDSIEKCKDFITFNSTVFTIHVTSNCGVARKVAVTGIIKDGARINQIAIISD